MTACRLFLAFSLATARVAGRSTSVRGAVQQKVTPVEKVIELLKNLQGELEGEAKAEAAQYDKYACFCKEQVDEKQYAIEKSTKKIEELDAEITALNGDITVLNGDISDLSLSISGLESEIQLAADNRASEHANYTIDEKDTSDAIAAIVGAIAALSDSKSAMTGSKLDLAQKVSRAVGAVSRSPSVVLSQEQSDALAVISKLTQGPTKYEYHANDIIATLEGLRKMFIDRKNELDTSEFEAKAAWEKRDTNLKNTMSFQSKAKAEKEKISAYKTELEKKRQAEKSEESADMAADGNFLNELKGECEAKATLFDQRSGTRTSELTAIADALGQLESGVAPSYGANKKLVGLQARAASAPVKGHWVWVDNAQPSTNMVTSFLQRRSLSDHSASGGSARQSAASKMSQQVVELLSTTGHRYKSPLLALAAVRVQAAEDHFVKVRQIIKDLMARLEADALSEQTQKSFCDLAMASAISSRDATQGQLESLAATKASLQSEQATLMKEIGELSAAIADMKKAIIEATELRDAERAENQKTVSTAEQGKAAVGMALQFLKDFYDNAFAQTGSSYTPPNADRDGKTVSDRAPEVFDSTYHGDQAQSKGIVGLLEVIQSDFDRTITAVNTEEGVAQGAYDSFKSTTESDINIKTNSKGLKEARVTAIDDELITNTDDTKEQGDLHKTALAELEGLHSQCVAGEETYEDRVAKREKEIEALKQALSMLENWQA